MVVLPECSWIVKTEHCFPKLSDCFSNDNPGPHKQPRRWVQRPHDDHGPPVTTDEDQPTLPVPPQACQHRSGFQKNVRQSLMISRESRGPQGKLTVGRQSWLNNIQILFSTLQRNHENNRNKTITTKWSQHRDKTTATKRPSQNDRNKQQNDFVGLGQPRHCELLFKLLTFSPVHWYAMNITTSFFSSSPLKGT